MIGPRWYVVETHVQAERLAFREIAERGYRAELLTQVVERRDPVIRSHKHLVHVPLFSQFVFVEMDRDRDPWTPIKYQCAGVKELLMTESGRPIPVEAGLIESFIRDAPERLKLPLDRLEPFEPGACLFVERGTLAGCSAQCVSCDGLMTEIVVALFAGRPTKLQVRREYLRAEAACCS